MTAAAPHQQSTTGLVPVALIDPDPDNVRLTPPSAADDDMLATSMREQGQIEPIGIRENPDADGRFLVVFGERRLRCAIKLGWPGIEATKFGGIDLITAKAMQVAENAHRAAMHPLDTWQAMVSLQARGMSLQLAAQCLGIEERRARQLDRLGRIAPTLIDYMRKAGIPDESVLARVCEAPQDVQARVFKRLLKEHGGHLHWPALARELRASAIPQSHAIFDIEKAKGIAWQEDVFAQPGDKNAITTTDVRAFMKHQTAALQEMVARRAKRGEHVTLIEGLHERIETPAGYAYCWDKPRSMKLPKDDPRMLFLALSPTGKVLEELAIAEGKRAKKPKTQAAAGDVSIAKEPPRSMTKPGMQMLVEAKTRAIAAATHQAVQDNRMSVTDLLQLLCLAVCADNVKINGSSASIYNTTDMRDFLPLLLTEEGSVDTDAEITHVATQIIGRMLVVTNPHTRVGSGGVAEAIGAFVAAEKAIEPLDSEDFLKTLSVAALKEAAKAADVTGAKTGAALREQLVGRIGDRWRPAEAAFVPTPIARNVEWRDDDQVEDGEVEDEAEAA